ncbi:FAD-dependent oxidoreductase [Myxococcota bacterium]|nr:FAD-dependent oxidoreductase [Myxococcota bacterium]
MRTALDLVLHPDAAEGEGLRRTAAAAIGVDVGRITEIVWRRRTIDARHGKVRIQARVEVFVDEAPPAVDVEGAHAPALPTLHGEAPVVVVGAGPAGLFCAWALALRGVRSVLIERGADVRGRRPALARLNREGVLDPESNYCFGEGGAGTFSDGKLYTRATKRGDVDRVLGLLAACGAPPRILYDARPHIGTNRLPKVVQALRERLQAAGVDVRFGARVDDLELDGRRVRGVRLADGCLVPARAVVLATGHSARDVYALLHRRGVAMSAKGFALGVRIEHPQAHIDRIQYGALAGHPALGAAPYSLARTDAGIGVYSFCMCPGGFIVAAATETDGVVVNGMSPHARGSRFANSGFVVSVGPETFGDGPLDGLAWQQRLEQAAFRAGGGGFRAPAQRVTDFLAGRVSADLPDCSYRPGLAATDLHAVLPKRIAGPMADALRAFDARSMRGYVTREAVMLGVESRSSAPVRIERDPQSLESPSHPGLYPCAEGAGYAGGIVSAALDGLRVAARVSDCVAGGAVAR